MNTYLRTIILDWQERTLPTIIPRDQKINTQGSFKVPLTTVITGFRRTGKTYLMYQTILELLQTVSRDQILYLNFEDERLGVVDTSVLTDLIPTFVALYGHKPRYFFLDELQLVPLWSKWVRRILDTEPEIKIFITGSSSKMSSAELPTELRGRSQSIHVFSLSFPEFLRFKDIPIPQPQASLSTDEHSRLINLFEEYLLYGGLPAVVLSPLSQKIELLQSYFDTVVARDLMERQQIKDIVLIKTILKILANSPHFTVSRLHNSLKSLGFAVAKATIINYLEFIEQSYFFSPLYIYNRSAKNTLLYPRISYLVDNGMLTALSQSNTINYGRLFENLVYQQLKRKSNNIYYYRNSTGHEVDFLIDGKSPSLIQASYDLSALDTLEREYKSLIKCFKDFPHFNKMLIAHLIPPHSFGKKYHSISALDFFLS